MCLRNTLTRYGAVAKSFHWLIALLIIGMLGVGLWMGGLANGPGKFKIYGLHKSVGITILALVGLRLIWKVMNVSPLLPASLPKWEKFLAHVGHAVLYVLMFAMPLSGWMASSASGFPVSVFGWFTLPNLVSPDKELKHTLWQAHEILAWCLIAMICLHALAALLHHFYYKNNVLRRMLPFVKTEKTDA